MKILITGATSMIGSSLCNRLLDDGHEVIGVVRKGSNKLQQLKISKSLKLIELDMDQYGQIGDFINEPLDAAFLMAWNGTRGADRMNALLQKSNVKIYTEMLQSIEKTGCKLLFTSGSQAEYSPNLKGDCICEDAVSQPNTEYGKSKLEFYNSAKNICNKYGTKLYEPRYFSLYGPNDYSHSLIMSVISKFINNEQCDLTACTQKWDYLYIDDAIDGLNRLLTGMYEEGIYNFGKNEGLILKDYIYKIHKLTNSTSLINFGTIPYPKTGIVNINPNINKLKNTGWSPKTEFEDGIREIIRKEFYLKIY